MEGHPGKVTLSESHQWGGGDPAGELQRGWQRISKENEGRDLLISKVTKVGDIRIQHPLCDHFPTAKSEPLKIYTISGSEGTCRPQAFDCKLQFYRLLDRNYSWYVTFCLFIQLQSYFLCPSSRIKGYRRLNSCTKLC